ncbi:hypothetical protein BGZ76_006139 [Entomortierella beljakovae]|nr:hypothetical protein BGZ76_006139 [Entomortierella beljakovae]
MQLDQIERDTLGKTGSNSKEASQNMDDSGFFSVQVISHALSILNLQIIPWGAKEVSNAKSMPEREAAFICNLDEHWYTLRRFGDSTQRWYDLNSLYPEPRYMTATFLGVTLSQLEAEGYSIFVVRPLTENDKPALTSDSNENAMDVTATATSSSTEPSPLSERQEMERLRRQRIEERERAANPQSSSSSNTVQVQVEKEAKNTTESILVEKPSFLPPCDADRVALVTPHVETSEAKKSQEHQPFGGAGYRLENSPPLSAANSSSLPPGFSLQDSDFMDGEDADWEMMQQAIAMSLQKPSN